MPILPELIFASFLAVGAVISAVAAVFLSWLYWPVRPRLDYVVCEEGTAWESGEFVVVDTKTVPDGATYPVIFQGSYREAVAFIDTQPDHKSGRYGLDSLLDPEGSSENCEEEDSLRRAKHNPICFLSGVLIHLDTAYANFFIVGVYTPPQVVILHAMWSISRTTRDPLDFD